MVNMTDEEVRMLLMMIIMVVMMIVAVDRGGVGAERW